jgi:hypothetical protein
MTKCKGCGKRFEARRSTRRYCSNACRQKGYREHHGTIELLGLKKKIRRDLAAAGLLPGTEIPGWGAIRYCNATPSWPPPAEKFDDRKKSAKKVEWWFTAPIPPHHDPEMGSRRRRARDDWPFEWRRSPEVAEVVFQASAIFLKAQGLAGLAAYLPFLVNEPELAHELGIDCRDLRELLEIEAEARRILDACPMHPGLREWFRIRRESPESRIWRAQQAPRRTEDLALRAKAAKLALTEHPAGVTPDRAYRNAPIREGVSSMAIASDEQLALDAERLLTAILPEILDMAIRLRERFPTDHEVSEAVEALIRQVQRA